MPRPASSSDAQSFVRIAIDAADRDGAERLAAEAYEAGAVGLEERDGEGGRIALLVYAPAAAAGAVVRALQAHAGPRARIDAPEPLAAQDWSEAWKAGLGAIHVSERLCVRPSFVAPAGRPGQTELVIDPGQAFGTGAHASTRLALEWIDRLAPGLPAGARILDVGCGTGVLALAALRRSQATRAVALDLDPEAARATRANARLNGLAARIDVLRGPLAALRERGFALVVANLLRTELLPLVAEIARHTAAGGEVVCSGLLEAEREQVGAALGRVGLVARGARSASDPGGDAWISLLTRR